MAVHKKRNLMEVAVVVLIIAVVLSSFAYFDSQKPFGGKMESLAIAYSPFESLGLFWVAQEQGFFAQNSLNITTHSYASGAGALSGVASGEADIAIGTAEFPLVIRALNNESVQTMATISKSNFVYLVARSDRGISSIPDLRGKTVGTTFGTVAHYYLGRFLVLNGLGIEDVTLVDLRTPTDWVNAIVNGSIDAVATAQPYANSAKDSLGSNAIVWSINSDQPQFTQAIARKGWIEKNSVLCTSFLRALYQAEQFIFNHPAEAKTTIRQQMNFTDTDMQTVWTQNQYFLSLDPALIQAMESEARWLISNKLTNQTATPDFINFIYVNALISAKPESVTVTP